MSEERAPRPHKPDEVDNHPYWLTTCMSPSGLRGCFQEWRVYSEREALRVFICPECRGR